MVLPNRHGLTSELRNLKFPDSCLATNETSVLRGTKLLAPAWVLQWKGQVGESMVPVNTPQSLWLGAPLMRAQQWHPEWDIAPMAAWGQCVWLDVAGSWDTLQLEGKNKKLKYQITLVMAQPLPQQKLLCPSPQSLKLALRGPERGPCTRPQLACAKLPVAQPDQPGQCQGHSCTSLWEKSLTGARTWGEFISTVGVFSQSTSSLLLGWERSFNLKKKNHIMKNITLWMEYNLKYWNVKHWCNYGLNKLEKLRHSSSSSPSLRECAYI